MVRTKIIGCAVGTALFTSTGAFAGASIIAPGTYQLHNHEDGNAANPFYGMRLDEVIDVTPGHDIFTFDFDAPGADMRLDYDGTSIHIYGTAFGGLDTGSEYDNALSGLVAIDFTYGASSLLPADDDIIVNTPDFTNTGSITLWNQDVVPLWDYSGDFGYTFQLGDHADDAGHRGFEGVSGWGWLNHTNMDDHVAASDWLFTVGEPVPGPAALGLFALAGLSRRRRRA